MTFEKGEVALCAPMIEAISDLMSEGRSNRKSLYGPDDSIATIRVEDFQNMEDFEAAYKACNRPAVCFVEADQVANVVHYLRDNDEIALIGEPAELIEWRYNRILRAFAKQIDPMTKTYLRDELMKSLKLACESATPFCPASLILLDVDHFKSLNDRFGVEHSNKLLGELGALIRFLCPETMVARTRGGEFGILIEANEVITKKIAEIIHNSITAKEWAVESRASEDDEPITASFGIATTFSNCTPSLLLTQADEALFAAKANGRSRVVSYSEITKISSGMGDDVDVINMENKARVLSERVTSFVTQRSKQIMETLRQEANTDGLTQLFNRRYIDKRLAEEFNLALANETQLSVALIDLDHFGRVNKNHGWPTGDKVLKEVAQTITEKIRTSDWVGRYGGEEICLIMPGTDLESAAVVCERVRSAIETSSFESTTAESLEVTLSVGVVSVDPTDNSVGELLDRVSQNALRAKNAGRNRVDSSVV